MRGGYVRHLHCHFNIAGCEGGGYGFPLSEDIKKCPAFCKDGNFRANGDYDLSNTILLKYSELMFLELQAQYQKFIEITGGKANYKHVDFHLWDNRRLPVAMALGKFLRKNKIKRCRIVGMHQYYKGKQTFIKYFIMRILLFIMRILSYSPFTNTFCSTRINYFIHKKDKFRSSLIEFYVHPDIIEGQVYDNTAPIFGDKKHPLKEQIQLAHIEGYKLSNWEDYSEI